ncbi:transcriptional regulator [Aggregatibacter actinomycetemcomitans]|uniref:AbrB/MazE/SpoVT family DNA-binding domain-containing protein n=1 Tax=Aggregatibacter actinomycetemcomitans TaxID=714 RepID=UPI00197C1D83|nr:transcriptional regulator [Aggregatibacter actinomycetemcomitans]MBN6073943.1 transcriptional regulator [Aggregatibacter actinomycetemcomitans]MBN6076357.1 transcriptional regulator [Aggregatibacter actinomycetemcomitans]
MQLRQQATLGLWGKCIGLRLTGNLRTVPQFSAGDVVDIEISENGLYISKSQKKLTEADLLKGITKYNAHADEFNVATLPQELDY